MKLNHVLVAEESAIAAHGKLIKELYQAGYAHGLRGGQLDRIEYFKLSFREGFRAAKLYLREQRRRQGVIEFPIQGRLKIKAM